MDAARAAELAKSLEDLTDGFLDAQIGIEAEAEIAMPDVSDRHADAQLATSCLGPSGLKHPGAQNAELELADAALHAQEQTVVRATRIVRSVMLMPSSAWFWREFKMIGFARCQLVKGCDCGFGVRK